MKYCGTLLLICLLTFTVGAYAQSQTTGPRAAFDPDSALVEALEGIPGEPLSLVAALALALENAIAIHDAQAVLDAAKGIWMQEKGDFDPELFAELSRSSSETPSSSPFSRPDVISEETTSAAAGARMRLPIGTEIEVAIDTRELDTNSEFAAIDPEYRADGQLSIRQPLLKGFGVGTSAPRSAAERSVQAAREAQRHAVLNTRADVETVYWELHAAERDYAVHQLIVDQARRQAMATVMASHGRPAAARVIADALKEAVNG